jgi:serine/threonine protein phosphatase PrpC
MRYAALSHAGKVREINEDNLYADGSIFVVADGMGGHQAGEVASTMAIETFLAGFVRRLEDADIPPAIEKAVQEASQAIFREAAKSSDKEGMGTTFTVAVFQGREFYLGHVGDSRAYLWKDGKLEQLTEDHSLVAGLVRSGRITPAQAVNHPQRNIITRALGIDEEVQVDIFEVEVPERGFLLLCSDGLNGMVSDERICEILAGGAGLEGLAAGLVNEAVDLGGSDNITVVLIDLATYDPEQDSAAASLSRQEEEEEEVAGSGETRPRPNWRPAALVLLGVCFLIILAALFFVPYLKNRSYFVGVNEQGTVTLYRGFPWKPLGISLKDTRENSDALADNLPDYKQESLRHPSTLDEEGAKVQFRSLTQEALTHQRVPDLMGLNWETARDCVIGDKLLLSNQEEGQPAPDALVIEQNPAAGELVEMNRVIYVKLQSPTPVTGGGS